VEALHAARAHPPLRLSQLQVPFLVILGVKKWAFFLCYKKGEIRGGRGLYYMYLCAFGGEKEQRADAKLGRGTHTILIESQLLQMAGRDLLYSGGDTDTNLSSINAAAGTNLPLLPSANPFTALIYSYHHESTTALPKNGLLPHAMPQ
jgi:hypothetical protein